MHQQGPQQVNIEQVLDGHALKGMPLQVAITMAIVLIADGFDIILLGYVAPAVAAEFGITHGGMGAVLTASFLGVVAGGFLGGSLGDRYGRKFLINVSLILFGLATLVSAVTDSVVLFTLARTLVGFGLGAATPNAAALMAEVLPSRWRSQIITVAHASSTIGTVVAGVLARQMLPEWGWRGLFVVGAVFPLLVCLLMMPWLPESPRFLSRQQQGQQRTARALNRLVGETRFRGDEEFVHSDSGEGEGRFRDLLATSFRRDTLCLGGIIFTVLFAWVAIGNWGTTVITAMGHELSAAVSVMIGYNLAGLFGAIGTALVLRRLGSRRVFTALAVTTIAASVLLGTFLQIGEVTLFWIGVYVVIAGACLTSLLQASYPLAAYVYPTRIRATGVGSVFGFGRLGAVASSAVTAGLLALGGSPLVFGGIALAAAGALIGTRVMQHHIPHASGAAGR